MNLLIFNSRNRKLGKIACTYLPIEQTCPNSCKLKGTICYGETGYVGIINSRLQKQYQHIKSYDIIRKESRQIISNKHFSFNIPLRLHVIGDVKTDKQAKLLKKAATYWQEKVFAYTHSWKNVSRKSWGSISVLASTESIQDAKKVLRKGYAPSIVVPSFKSKRAYFEEGIKLIPCPQQTKENITCAQCKLCMRDKFLKENKSAIAFAVHGIRKNRALKVLK